MSSGDRENDRNEDEEEQQRRWHEIYGDMIPERIVDTKIGEDGKRYYKVQWAASAFEPAKNFLEAELLIRKYWDPVEKKLKLPTNADKSKRREEKVDQGCSSSNVDSSVDTADNQESEGTSKAVETNHSVDQAQEYESEQTQSNQSEQPIDRNSSTEKEKIDNVRDQDEDNNIESSAGELCEVAVNSVDSLNSSVLGKRKCLNDDSENDADCQQTDSSLTKKVKTS